jgi:hypothetical protein
LLDALEQRDQLRRHHDLFRLGRQVDQGAIEVQKQRIGRHIVGASVLSHAISG